MSRRSPTPTRSARRRCSAPPRPSSPTPASAILVFDADAVSAATPNSAFVVKRSDARGRITDLVPDLIQHDKGRLLVLLPKFSTYWVAIKGQPFVLADYWPLRNGDVYEFDNGVVLQLSETTAEPQMSQPMMKATFLTATGDIGMYLERTASAETLLLGRFSVAAGFQELETQPLLLLPRQAELGYSGYSKSDVVGFQPYGSPVPSFAVREELTTTLITSGPLHTPLGQFQDVIEIEILCEREATTPGSAFASGAIRDRLWLARGIGPVHIALQGLPRGQLTGGVVVGQPLTKQ